MGERVGTEQNRTLKRSVGERESDSGFLLFYGENNNASETETAMANTSLEDVPSMDLMTELLRRFKCSSKPDKRLILIGISIFLSLEEEFSLSFRFAVNPDPKMLLLNSSMFLRSLRSNVVDADFRVSFVRHLLSFNRENAENF